MLNHPNTTCYAESTADLCSADLEALAYDKDLVEGDVDETHDIAFNNYPLKFHQVFGPGIYEHFMSKYKVWVKYFNI